MGKEVVDRDDVASGVSLKEVVVSVLPVLAEGAVVLVDAAVLELKVDREPDIADRDNGERLGQPAFVHRDRVAVVGGECGGCRVRWRRPVRRAWTR